MQGVRKTIGILTLPLLILSIIVGILFSSDHPALSAADNGQPAQITTLPQPRVSVITFTPVQADLAAQDQLTPTSLPVQVLATATPASGSSADSSSSAIPTSPPDEFAYAPPEKVTTCAEIWQIPSMPNDLPAILVFPPSIDDLKTEYNYYYLAAMLIQNKAVNASSCANNGLQSATTANQCGVELAKPKILSWQNSYDSRIFETGVRFGLPSRLLKKVFALESQFWPGIYIDITESGLGQLNETGADALLMYNSDFYNQFCPLVLYPATCAKGYLGLGYEGRSLLRGALVRQVNASCDSCPMGINTIKAMNSIPIFGEVLKANCSQVDMLIGNTTDKKAGQAADYVDLWKLTLANYNVGPGCTADAIQKAWEKDQSLAWGTVSQYFQRDECAGAPFYVNDIFK